jgi:amidophosphoribosyltransferase
LRRFLDADAHRHINTDSDSELLLNIFANNLQKTGKFRINEEDIFTAIKDLMVQCRGGYACVAMIAGFGIIGFRDPNGIRPLGMCWRKGNVTGAPTAEHGRDWCFTSESVVSDALGYEGFEDVRPGEAVIITKNAVSRRVLKPPSTEAESYAFSPDIFEYVYFARPDSVMDGVSVYRSRMAMGDKLAEEVRRVLASRGEAIDVVIPVPDTSRVAALQLAQRLNIPYREGFVKNRYVGRTFIMPGQSTRRKNVRRKLNAMALEFAGKSVLLVDDSIVRGTTSREIIQMARDAGAKRVIMASCAPPIRFSNVYGIDMPSRHELVAHGRTEEEVAAHIQADLVIYQTLPDLIDSVRQFNPAIPRFDCSVFDGKYVTGGVDDAYLSHLEGLRSENAKIKAASSYINGQSPAETVDPSPVNTRRPSAGALNGGSVFGMEPNGLQHARPNGSNLLSSCSGPMNGADAAEAEVEAEAGEDISLFNGYTR